MSALEMFSQTMVSSSYCESRLVSGEAVAGNVLSEVELILRYVDASDGRVCGVFWCKLCQFVGWKLVLMQVATRESEQGRREATDFRLPQPLPPSLASITRS